MVYYLYNNIWSCTKSWYHSNMISLVDHSTFNSQMAYDSDATWCNCFRILLTMKLRLRDTIRLYRTKVQDQPTNVESLHDTSSTLPSTPSTSLNMDADSMYQHDYRLHVGLLSAQTLIGILYTVPVTLRTSRPFDTTRSWLELAMCFSALVVSLFAFVGVAFIAPRYALRRGLGSCLSREHLNFYWSVLVWTSVLQVCELLYLI